MVGGKKNLILAALSDMVDITGAGHPCQTTRLIRDASLKE
jgi:hypothetical protein